LTNFFNLSNIQPVTRRSRGMARTSRCFLTEFFKLDGPSTLAAADAVPCTHAFLASLIKPDLGVLRFVFPPGRKWHFLMFRSQESGSIDFRRSAPLSTAMRPVTRHSRELRCGCSRQRKNRNSGHARKGGSGRHLS
jgi:hypothetical protein